MLYGVYNHQDGEVSAIFMKYKTIRIERGSSTRPSGLREVSAV